ncbi:hypothetical protein [Paraburkholderia pallida]|uniref:Uncharacterized protein n=1 Tax=Paraburkholderia pallida TaxID=2547399 RepID=A0A4P7CPR5_9BURK|nr:hypothetical protein [Paraburkholderia pallida]QBQ95909.1 hypothetical protein E1956_01080 [Paraburkholderia pallida]
MSQTAAVASVEVKSTEAAASGSAGSKRVVVVDDELAGERFSELGHECAALLEDPNGPEFNELWEIAKIVKDPKEWQQWDINRIRQYLTSDAVVSEVILSAAFRDRATDALNRPLANFLARHEKIRLLKSCIQEAYPQPEFDVRFQDTRPAGGVLMQCELVILDLVLAGSANPVDEAVEYLKKFADDFADQALPPIIFMSSHDEVIVHQRRFSSESKISAAGLLVMKKADVYAESFGVEGLRLTYQQLSRQRDVAYRMRTFMRVWTTALDNARRSAERSIWNLDAAAMQEIHFKASADFDPYDGHLNELLAREYMWHVESDREVRAAIAALDVCFKDQIKGNPAKITHHFITPFVDPANLGTLLSRFTWTGLENPTPLWDVEAATASAEFNELVPFGALLVGEGFGQGAECLIHITQQCDLNGASRDPSSNRTVLFAVVEAIELKPHTLPEYTTQDLVARALKVEGKEYDFRLLRGRMLALSVHEFIGYADRLRYRVCGRLRQDIASHFTLASANHMTRPASQAMVRSQAISAKVFLRGAQIADQQVAFLDSSVPGAGRVPAKIFQLTRDGQSLSFQDDACIMIALWVKSEAKKAGISGEIDADVLCNALRTGRRDGQQLAGGVEIAVRTGKLQEAFKPARTVQASADRLSLVVVTESA